MTDSALVVPTDLKLEIEKLSQKEQRSEADVLRDAIQQYLAFHDIEKVSVSFARYLEMLSDGLLDSGDNANRPSTARQSPAVMPKSFGIASSGRVQSDRFDEWLKENWERDW